MIKVNGSRHFGGFFLLLKKARAALVTIDTTSGFMLRVSPGAKKELLPLGGNTDANALRKWWQRRAVPVGQGKIRQILEKKLPEVEELKGIYALDPLIPCVESILLGYRKKAELLSRFQDGKRL